MEYAIIEPLDGSDPFWVIRFCSVLLVPHCPPIPPTTPIPFMNRMAQSQASAVSLVLFHFLVLYGILSVPFIPEPNYQTSQRGPGLEDHWVYSFRHFLNLVFLFHFWSMEMFMLLLGLAIFDIDLVCYPYLMYIWTRRGVLSTKSLHYFNQKLMESIFFICIFTDLGNGFLPPYTL